MSDIKDDGNVQLSDCKKHSIFSKRHADRASQRERERATVVW